MSPFVIWALLGIVRKDKCEHWRGRDMVLCISASSLSFKLPELTLYCKTNSYKHAGHILHKDALVSWVIHHFLYFFCIIKKVNVHLGLYVASVEINFIRFNHSIPFGLMSQRPAVQGIILQQRPLEVSAFPLASDIIQNLLQEAVENSVCDCRATR